MAASYHLREMSAVWLPPWMQVWIGPEYQRLRKEAYEAAGATGRQGSTLPLAPLSASMAWAWCQALSCLVSSCCCCGLLTEERGILGGRRRGVGIERDSKTVAEEGDREAEEGQEEPSLKEETWREEGEVLAKGGLLRRGYVQERGGM